MTNPRCVIDTNVLISAALSPLGKPRRVVDFVVLSGTLLASTATFHEFETRIRRPRLLRYFGNEEEREGFIHRIHSVSRFEQVTTSVSACSDPDDDMFLELALSAGADYIITGNLKDFPPSPFQGIPILRPAEFVETVIPKEHP